MADINIQEDLTTVNNQIGNLVEELNKVNSARDNLIQQVQNLNGVAMYLRGKLKPDEVPDVLIEDSEENDLGRSSEYPETTP